MNESQLGVPLIIKLQPHERETAHIRAPACRWFPPHWWNNALMLDLKPSTVYYYVYGSDANGWSEEESFVSAPAPGPHQEVTMPLSHSRDLKEAA